MVLLDKDLYNVIIEIQNAVVSMAREKHLIKKRIKSAKGQSEVTVFIATDWGTRWFFIFGIEDTAYPLTAQEYTALKMLAVDLLSLTEIQITHFLFDPPILEEIVYDR
jgi:hypothetical protein